MEEVAVQTGADQVHWVVEAFNGGGTAMYFIAAVGIMVVVLILERFVSMKSLVVNKEEFNKDLYSKILKGDLNEAVAYCDTKSTPLTNTLKSGLVQVINRRPDEEIQVAMDAMVLKETPRLEGWTGFLAVFGNVATLIGLLGTILGLIRSFAGVAAVDPSQKATELSAGIAEALNCTAFGLAVAIISIVAYGYFQVRVSRAVNDLLESSMSLMNLVVSNRDKLKEV